MEDHNENGFNKNRHNEDKQKGHVSIHWFRNCLRLHDNPALLAALENAQEIYPLFIVDEEINGLFSLLIMLCLLIKGKWYRRVIFHGF